MYRYFKKMIPARVRKFFKPYYLSWSLRKFKDNQIVKVVDGPIIFEIEIDPRNGAVDEYIFMHKNWEPYISEVIRRKLKIGDVFVDVGANIGVFTLLAAKIVGETGKVMAFEPIPRLVEQIGRSARLNQFSNIKVIQKAVGASPANMRLASSSHNIGGSTLVEENNAEEFHNVSVSALDSELANQPKIDLIKIDVEGFEYEVLLGAKEVMSKHQPKIILEFSPSLYSKQRNQTSSSILSLLISSGYQCVDIQTKQIADDISDFLIKLGDKQTDLFCFIPNKKPY